MFRFKNKRIVNNNTVTLIIYKRAGSNAIVADGFFQSRIKCKAKVMAHPFIDIALPVGSIILYAIQKKCPVDLNGAIGIRYTDRFV